MVGMASKSSVGFRRALPALLSLQKEGVLELRAVCSVSKPSFAQWVSEMYQIPARPDTFEELLERPDIDAVYISKLPTEHVELAIHALLAGKHVFVEKPFLFQPDDEIKLVRAAASKYNLFAINHTYFGSPLQEDRFSSLLSLNRIGQIQSIQVSIAGAGHWLEDPRDWHWDATKGGGAGRDLLPHALTIATCILGYVPSMAWQVSAKPEANRADSMFTAWGVHPRGPQLLFEVDWTKPRRHEVIISGIYGSIRIEMADHWKVTRIAKEMPEGVMEPDEYHTDTILWWRSMFLHFIAGNLKPAVGLDVEKEVMRMYENLRINREVPH